MPALWEKFIGSNTVYTKPLELIFCDLWGPSPVQCIYGYTYFLTWVDAYSRYTWIYPLKIKSDTLTTLVQFKALVELQCRLKIKSVQTDVRVNLDLSLTFLSYMGSLIESPALTLIIKMDQLKENTYML